MDRCLSGTLAVLFFLLTACQPIQAPVPVVTDDLVLIPPPTSVKQYAGLELPLTTTLTVDNPYDPAQIDLRVHFTGPDGQRMTVPAFWAQDFDTVTQTPTGNPGWRVRFTPSLSGVWTAQADLVTQNVRSQPITFTVAASDNPGFVRIDSTNSMARAPRSGHWTRLILASNMTTPLAISPRPWPKICAAFRRSHPTNPC